MFANPKDITDTETEIFIFFNTLHVFTLTLIVGFGVCFFMYYVLRSEWEIQQEVANMPVFRNIPEFGDDSDEDGEEMVGFIAERNEGSGMRGLRVNMEE